MRKDFYSSFKLENDLGKIEMSFDFISGFHNNKNFIVNLKTCFRENTDNLNKEKIIYPGAKDS